jgi:hypothetical protein
LFVVALQEDIRPSGGTNTQEALLQSLKQFSSPSPFKAVFLFTDGIVDRDNYGGDSEVCFDFFLFSSLLFFSSSFCLVDYVFTTT